MAAYTNPPDCNVVYNDESKVPLGVYYWTSKDDCKAADYSKALVGTYTTGNSSSSTSNNLVLQSVNSILSILDGLITTIAGKGRSILTGISEDVQYVSRQVSNLGDNLNVSTRLLSDQVNNSQNNINAHISAAVSTVNDHTDAKVKELEQSITDNQAQTMSRFDKVDSEIAGIGETIANALTNAINPIVQAIRDTEEDLSRSIRDSMREMEDKVTNAINTQTERFSLAINNAATSIDRLNFTTEHLVNVVSQGFSDLEIELRKDLKDHGNTIANAIRESSAGLTSAVVADTAAEVLGYASIVAAIAAGSTEIAAAITAANTEQLAAQAPKIAKDIELADIIISILSIAGAGEILNNPQVIADFIKPFLEAYYNIGQAITPQFSTEG